jgi:hypothetical protein
VEEWRLVRWEGARQAAEVEACRAKVLTAMMGVIAVDEK